jgi:peptide chain release factor 2
MKGLRAKTAGFYDVEKAYADVCEYVEIALMEGDGSVIPEIRGMMKEFVNAYDELRIATLLNGEYDGNNAILSLHSGAGGTEACDWAEMLMRMYSKWAAKRGFTVEVLDYLAGDEAGVKSVTLQISGENAFGYLRSERGVHRLVRISPFDAAGKRHTSFCSCDVMPEIDDNIAVDISPEDLKIDTYRSGGAGGQHVNTTDSAIRITHLPTNTVVQCQNERSQHKNKDRAMKMLKSRLFEIKQREQVERITDIRGDVKDIGWSSQIRSYVFHPYSMVKDLRTRAEVGNVGAVMDGGIDVFINAYLLSGLNRND